MSKPTEALQGSTSMDLGECSFEHACDMLRVNFSVQEVGLVLWVHIDRQFSGSCMAEHFNKIKNITVEVKPQVGYDDMDEWLLQVKGTDRMFWSPGA